MQTTKEAVELFHLLFLHQLEGKLDKKLYALKGGCNLRFFFKSVRYSEDIDFDVAVVSKTTLENKITKILNGETFKRILLSKQIEIIQVTSAKQTDTTQRWKILLRINQSNVPVPTKIEFSRRRMDKGVAYKAIDADVIRQYKLYPIFCNHYEIETAFSQKINALISRNETQARDVFDLKLLLDQDVQVARSAFTKEELKKAIDIVLSINYEDFKGQVVAYLMSQYQEIYGSVQSWNEIQTQVIDVLQELVHASH